MDKKRVVCETEVYVKETLARDSSGHDWWHVYRVRQNALNIGRHEAADLFVVELAALLHDIADFKLHGGDETLGTKVAQRWLEKLGVDGQTIAHVVEIIKGLSFKGANVDATMRTKEGRVAQDADRLDAIGAIGIGRAFAYGGYKGRLLYDPEIKPQKHSSFEAYKRNTSPTINHFYEKLLLLKGLMNTETARKIAEARHEVMEQFLDRFFMEWGGADVVS